MEVADSFNRAPRRPALQALQKFGVPTGTPISTYLHSFRVVVASMVEEGDPWAPPAVMVIELFPIITVQQYPILMPTLFPAYSATGEKPYAPLVSMWSTFSNLKQNTSPAI